MNTSEKSQFIKSLAYGTGFDFCGIAAARHLDEDARKLENWLQQGKQGNMYYMEKHFDLRVNPYKLLPGAKSVICFLINYFPDTNQENNAPKISKYAYGKDYHEIIRPKLQLILAQMKEKFGDFHGRGFVDSAPVLERSWAVISGLGWVGKNGNLIHKKRGSFFFIATLIVDLELAYDAPEQADYCGTCTRCIDACPTEAIEPDKVVNGSKCISYFTIELKDDILPADYKGKFEDWMFGCDICQQVCPINARATRHNEPQFEPRAELLAMSRKDWEELSEDTYKRIFLHSAVKRTKFKGLKRNIDFLGG